MPEPSPQPRAIREYVENGAHTDPMVRYELWRAARDEVNDILRNASRQQPSVTFAQAEPIPSLIDRAIEAIRAEYGITWPLWAAAYVTMCLIGAAGAALALAVQP